MKHNTLHTAYIQRKHSVTGNERLTKTVELYLHDGTILFIFTIKQALTQLVRKTMSMSKERCYVKAAVLCISKEKCCFVHKHYARLLTRFRVVA